MHGDGCRHGGFCNRNYIDGPPDKPAAGKERKEREAEPKAKRKDKEEVKERVAPAPKPVPPPAAAQPAPAIVPPPPPPVAVQPAPAQQLMTNFQTARALILSGKYEAGIAAMKTLGYDDHPDVADSIGFANAKLGNLAEARMWYSKALAADPNHLRSWSDFSAHSIWCRAMSRTRAATSSTSRRSAAAPHAVSIRSSTA